MKDTVIVNLFAGPGAGKTTGAWYISAKLKMAGVDVEYISEFAKDKVWEENDLVFKNQFYITGKQAWKVARCDGKMEVAVTDSPILLGAMYCEDNPDLISGIKYEFNKHKNINFFIERHKKYNPNGRLQTEEEAKAIDTKVKDFLIDNHIPYTVIPGTEKGYLKAVDIILKELGIQ